MTDKVCAALVGLDNPHSKGWLTSLQHCEAVGRLVVCAAEECTGVDQVYGSLDALLADEKLGLAIVCTRNDQAPDLIAQLLQAGVPVIAEKPVARTAADIVRLNEIAAAQQVLWATAFLNRCHPIAGKMRELIAAGVLGRIVSIEGRMVTSTVQQRNPDHWLFDRALAGGGILHWLAIHTVDLVRYISGLEYESVSAPQGDAERHWHRCRGCARRFVPHGQRRAGQPSRGLCPAAPLRRYLLVFQGDRRGCDLGDARLGWARRPARRPEPNRGLG